MDKITVTFKSGKTRVFEKAQLAEAASFLVVQQGEIVYGFSPDEIKSFEVKRNA